MCINPKVVVTSGIVLAHINEYPVIHAIHIGYDNNMFTIYADANARTLRRRRRRDVLCDERPVTAVLSCKDEGCLEIGCILDWNRAKVGAIPNLMYINTYKKNPLVNGTIPWT